MRQELDEIDKEIYKCLEIMRDSLQNLSQSFRETEVDIASSIQHLQYLLIKKNKKN